MALGLLAIHPTTAVFLDELLDNVCAAPQPCVCEYQDYYELKSVNCNNTQLRVVPAFKNTTTFVVQSFALVGLFEVHLDNNQLTTIPAFAFRNLPRVNGTRVFINLKDNKISQIDNDAFDGIAHIVAKLHLQNNLLSHLPQAFAKLSSIEELNVLENPLTQFDGVVMNSFGRSLFHFSFSADHFAFFPTEIRLLYTLMTLTVNGIPFHSLPSDAFQGYAPYLSEVNINHSQLDHIPDAVCNMTQLRRLSFTSSPNIKSSSVLFNHCKHYMFYVNSLSLYDNQLVSLPNISGWFPRLSKLNLSTNHLQHLSLGYFPFLSHLDLSTNHLRHLSLGYIPFLSDLDLSHNLFTQIPPALNNITWSLFYHLDMAGNQITSINDNDLRNLGYLKILELNNNPISYISPHAFKYNKYLHDIGLKHTNLFQIPLALKELGNIPSPAVLFHYHREVDFTDSPINCSCNAMPYLVNWNVTSLSIDGNCHGGRGTSIQRYVDHLFPATCP